MDDVTKGRINTENLTPEEWKLLETAERLAWWFTPTDEEWLACKGVLALVDVRRGYEISPSEAELTGGDVVLQFGVAQIRINEHGQQALYYHARGQFYQVGEPMTSAEIDVLLEEDGLL